MGVVPETPEEYRIAAVLEQTVHELVLSEDAEDSNKP